MTDNSFIRYEFWLYDGDSLCIDYYYFVYIPLCLKIRLLKKINNLLHGAWEQTVVATT